MGFYPPLQNMYKSGPSNLDVLGFSVELEHACLLFFGFGDGGEGKGLQWLQKLFIYC